MIAYKFLASGAVAPFTGFRWEPHVWVEAGRADPCAHGVHACRAYDLPLWLNTELWEVELDGEIVESARKVVAERARLTRRLEQWTPALAHDFGRFCARRTRQRVGFHPLLSGYAADAARFVSQRRIPLAAFAAARVAELLAGPAAYDAERRVQAEWLAARLGISP